MGERVHDEGCPSCGCRLRTESGSRIHAAQCPPASSEIGGPLIAADAGHLLEGMKAGTLKRWGAHA
jgi:hypothetical protein